MDVFAATTSIVGIVILISWICQSRLAGLRSRLNLSDVFARAHGISLSVRLSSGMPGGVRFIWSHQRGRILLTVPSHTSEATLLQMVAHIVAHLNLGHVPKDSLGIRFELEQRLFPTDEVFDQETSAGICADALLTEYFWDAREVSPVQRVALIIRTSLVRISFPIVHRLGFVVGAVRFYDRLFYLAPILRQGKMPNSSR